MKNKITRTRCVLLIACVTLLTLLVIGIIDVICSEGNSMLGDISVGDRVTALCQTSEEDGCAYNDVENSILETSDSVIQEPYTTVVVDCTEENSMLSEEIEGTQESTTNESSCTTVCVQHNETSQAIVNTQEVEAITTTEHIHTYAVSSSCIYYPEEGHYEEVCVMEGYIEEIYQSYDKYCYYCGAIMDTWSFDELLNHSSLHGAYGSYEMVVDTVWHEPVYENVWIVDQEEYYEEEVVVECIECGYIE